MELLEIPLKNGFNKVDETDFVTVVLVGSQDDDKNVNQEDNKSSGYVTVLTIGDEEPCDAKEKIEEVLVYRLPGERLGFGLKFEGGTKASEFVKRLFIQSCAPDSPASRVESSWGCLTEGDEVLEIDSVPVKSMTRSDCVRCLKDSNVVIKLLVKHNVFDDCKVIVQEDLPLVISAEKKRTPPPPPPVPPRKIPRKISKENVTVNPSKSFNETNGETPVPTTRQCHLDNGINNFKPRLESPRNSIKAIKARKSPEVVKRDRKISDGSIGPPDAEVYVDLFSQESPYCLSESDDTGSSISTVVDRFGSFPTTTTSSFAGSIPSTPTSVQRQINFSNVFNPFDEENDLNEQENYLFTKLVSLQNNEEVIDVLQTEKTDKPDSCPSLQPPANFQDAPLSYGDEDVRIVEAAVKVTVDKKVVNNKLNNFIQIDVENNMINSENNFGGSNDIIDSIGKKRPPPPPPRTKHQFTPREKNNNDYDVKNENCENLPRLVDFVPKLSKIETYEAVKRFLENEQRCDQEPQSHSQLNDNDDCNYEVVNWNEGNDLYTFNWNPSSQLATIGEDEEDMLLDSLQSSLNITPIVIVENTDENEDSSNYEETISNIDQKEEIKEEICEDVAESLEIKASLPSSRDAAIISNLKDVEVMEAPCIDSRQPPDGHEFPDFQEVPITPKPTMAEIPPKTEPRAPYVTRKEQQSSTSVRNMIAKFSNVAVGDNIPDGKPNDIAPKKGLSKSVMHINTIQSSLNTTNYPPSSTPNNFNRSNNRNSLDLTHSTHFLPETKSDLADATPPLRLHTRSQSMSDISDNRYKSTNDPWSRLLENRRKGLSKLKGLIIPEHTDADETVDLPEITSSDIPAINIETKPLDFQINNQIRTNVIVDVQTNNWDNDDSKEIPNYSPAFKRKPFLTKIENNKIKTESELKPIKTDKTFNKPNKQIFTSQIADEYRLPMTLPLNDAPKSLESITSPTRSDCSFEYISNSPDLKPIKIHPEPRKHTYKIKDEINKSEEDSDNDSAVSSSQSSYISRNSPPVSPNHLQSHFTTTRPCNLLENDPLERSRNKYELTGSDSQTADSLCRRMLKPQSVEAINRKNILASAKCRSGRDLKVGSPLIQRKFDETCVEPALDKIADITVEDKTNDVVNKEPPKIKPATNDPLPKKIEPAITKNRSLDNISTNSYETNGFSVRKSIARESSIEKEMQKKKVISRNNSSTSVTDLRKNFEKFAPTPSIRTSLPANINTKSLSNNNTAIKNFQQPAITKMKTNIPTTVKAQASVNVNKIKETVLSELKENYTKDELRVIVICPEIPGGSIGITLAGGSDYETKEITIHKVRNGSAAALDGRLQKGDRILYINGKLMKGITHAESIIALKEKVSEFIMVACSAKEAPATVLPPAPSRHSSSFDLTANIAKEASVADENKVEHQLSIKKEANQNSLGFSIEGGKDSPHGDVPLTIKKLFTGGSAQSGSLQVGDELMEINKIGVTKMSRLDAWALMKRIPEGEVMIKIRR